MADKIITVGLTPREKRQIRAEAGRRDKSMSELGREVLIEWLEEQSVEQGEN